MRAPRHLSALAVAALAVAAPTAAAVDVPPPAEPAAQTAAASPIPTPRSSTPRKPAPRFVFTFEGRGFGHGVGMSQYGAYGAALAGLPAERIIAMYYRGTTLATLPVTPVRVLLASGAASAAVRSTGGWTATIEGSPLQAPGLPPKAEVRFARTAAGGIVATNAAGGQILRAPGAVRLTPAGAAFLTFGGVRYRGSLRLIPGPSGVAVVNHVELEQYLLGVVPREMPSQWGDRAPAALEAQAIAARSFALATRKTGAAFDMYADERSQVYGGVSAEDPRATRAVAATAGKVVTYAGQIITTFFFSTSGGRTENVENVFHGPARPYLASVDDRAYDRLSPHHRWRDPKTFTDAQLARLLGTRRPVLRFVVVARGKSPRVRTIRVVTRSGAVKEMTGSQIRRALGLRDTWFSVRRRVRTPATLRLVTGLPRSAPIPAG